MEAMVASAIDFTIFFYNPNIHPRKEYDLRKDENIRFAEKFGIPFVDADYDRDNWSARARGMENEPEPGVRCTMCFDMRFERTALYAHGFPVITSSLGISRWKNMQQINDCGKRAASRYPELLYWDYNWRKGGGSARMSEISKRENFHQQEYCGCVYSLRDTNEHRIATGRERTGWASCTMGNLQRKRRTHSLQRCPIRTLYRQADTSPCYCATRFTAIEISQ